MGHQATFYATPTDIAELEKKIRHIEPMLILKWRSPTAEPRILPSLNAIEDGQRWLSYYLVRESQLSQVVTDYVPAQGYWTVEVLRSPVVQFRSCYFDGTILREGRVYYVDGFYGADDAWVYQPESFRKWAKAVLRTTKKALKREGFDYIGPDALAWRQREGGKFVT